MPKSLQNDQAQTGKGQKQLDVSYTAGGKTVWQCFKKLTGTDCMAQLFHFSVFTQRWKRMSTQQLVSESWLLHYL